VSTDRRNYLDDIDKQIINILQTNCRESYTKIASDLGISKSKLHYRIKRLEETGIIEGYYAKINTAELGYDLLVATNVKAKFAPNYHDKIGNQLKKIPGVIAVYFIYGESDFIILIRGKNKTDLFERIQLLDKIEGIERVQTSVITATYKEDPRFFFKKHA
jgi:Lrp/AsnC family transcriptional regulator for asnA, asnC and gidA